MLNPFKSLFPEDEFATVPDGHTVTPAEIAERDFDDLAARVDAAIPARGRHFRRETDTLAPLTITFRGGL